MSLKTPLLALVSIAGLLMLPGCAVTRGQSTVGAYVDDATITTQIKARMIENRHVDAAAIKVETLNGTVLLSGFAKSVAERNAADAIARGVSGVKSVRNDLVVRPPN